MFKMAINLLTPEPLYQVVIACVTPLLLNVSITMMHILISHMIYM